MATRQEGRQQQQQQPIEDALMLQLRKRSDVKVTPNQQRGQKNVHSDVAAHRSGSVQ